MRYIWDEDLEEDGRSSDAATEAPQSLPTVLQVLLSVDFLSMVDWETCSRPVNQLLLDPDIQGDAGACAQAGPGGDFGPLAARILQEHDVVFGYWRRKQPSKVNPEAVVNASAATILPSTLSDTGSAGTNGDTSITAAAASASGNYEARTKN